MKRNPHDEVYWTKEQQDAYLSGVRSSALLCCPFCGAEAFVWPTMLNGWKVSCRKDCVTMPSRFDMGFTSEEGAKKHWNRRAT